MHKLVVVLVSFVDVEPVVNRSFEMMTENDELEVIGFVQEPSTLSELILEVGFLGKKVAHDVKTAVEQEYEERAHRNLRSIVNQGKEKQTEVKTKLLAASSLADLEIELNKKIGDYLLINYPRDEHCTGDVKTHPVEEILTNLKVPYEVFYDGERVLQEKVKL